MLQGGATVCVNHYFSIQFQNIVILFIFHCRWVSFGICLCHSMIADRSCVSKHQLIFSSAADISGAYPIPSCPLSDRRLSSLHRHVRLSSLFFPSIPVAICICLCLWCVCMCVIWRHILKNACKYMFCFVLEMPQYHPISLTILEIASDLQHIVGNQWCTEKLHKIHIQLSSHHWAC